MKTAKNIDADTLLRATRRREIQDRLAALQQEQGRLHVRAIPRTSQMIDIRNRIAGHQATIDREAAAGVRVEGAESAIARDQENLARLEEEQRHDEAVRHELDNDFAELQGELEAIDANPDHLDVLRAHRREARAKVAAAAAEVTRLQQARDQATAGIEDLKQTLARQEWDRQKATEPATLEKAIGACEGTQRRIDAAEELLTNLDRAIRNAEATRDEAEKIRESAEKEVYRALYEQRATVIRELVGEQIQDAYAAHRLSGRAHPFNKWLTTLFQEPNPATIQANRQALEAEEGEGHVTTH